MWLDQDLPGCLYDTVDCCDCRGCCETDDDKTPMDLWREEKEEK
jgi:hypothetical protein